MATQRTLPTNPGLLAEAAHVVLPHGIVSSGFPAVERTCDTIGLTFDGWQRDLNRCILAKDVHGLYAADTVVISIPRQVGKTFNIGCLVFADSIINPGTTTVWTAHRFKVSRETFDALRALAKSPLLAPHIDYEAITTAAGNECIPFRNGSRIVFAARERGAIRGFTKVRRLVLDEAQILTESALSDMVPTMNQAENPQIILMGTPPKPNDPSEVFTNLRREALSGDSDGVLYVEFSAPKDSKLDDRAAWSIANPSFPLRTPVKAVLRMRKLLGPEDFRREALGVWDSDAHTAVVKPSVWSSRRTGTPPAGRWRAFALDMSPDRLWLGISVAARPEDGPVHLECVFHEPADRRMPDGRTAAQHAVEFLVDRRSAAVPVLVAAQSTAMSFVPELKVRGVSVTVLSETDMSRACGMFVDAIRDETLTHFDQAPLNLALSAAGKLDVGSAGGWVWNRRVMGVDLTPLVGVTEALYGVMSVRRSAGGGRAGGERRSVGGGRVARVS